MTTVASQITSLTAVYSIIYSGADKRKHQSSASLALCAGNSLRPVNSPHKGPVTRKMLPFDDVIMEFKWWFILKWHQVHELPNSHIAFLGTRWFPSYKGVEPETYYMYLLYVFVIDHSPIIMQFHLEDRADICTPPWWRHQMEIFSALLAIYAGNSPVMHRWIPCT